MTWISVEVCMANLWCCTCRAVWHPLIYPSKPAVCFHFEPTDGYYFCSLFDVRSFVCGLRVHQKSEGKSNEAESADANASSLLAFVILFIGRKWGHLSVFRLPPRFVYHIFSSAFSWRACCDSALFHRPSPAPSMWDSWTVIRLNLRSSITPDLCSCLSIVGLRQP